MIASNLAEAKERYATSKKTL